MDRRSRLAASILALLTAVSAWLSAGIVQGGDTTRIAAIPSFWVLAGLAVAFVAAAWVAELRLGRAWPLAISLVLWLPFLPFDVPAPFLIWEGPIEGVVWLLVVVGLIAAGAPSAGAVGGTVLTRPGSAPWIAAILLAVSSVLVFGQVRDVVPGGDEPHYLAATQSLLKDADLRVANNYAQGDYLAYFPGRLDPHYLKRAASGEIYSIHAPGVSVIVLPAFVVAGYRGAVATMILIAALTAALTWRIAYRISGSAAGAWLGVLGVFMTPAYFFHTFTIYPEVIGSFCVVCGVWLLIELDEGSDVSTRHLIAAGIAMATLPWLHSRFAVLAGILGLLIVARLISRPGPVSKIAAFLAVPVVAGIGWFAYFYLIWGSPSPAAPYGPDTSTSASYILRGLIGLLFDQQFGLVTTAPIYLVAIAGWFALLWKRPRLAIEMLLIVVPYAMTAASFAMWWAGSAAPARFLIAILPLAAIPIAVMASATARRDDLSTSPASWALPVVTVVLLAISVALVVPRALEDSGRFIYNSRSGVDATIRWLAPNVDLPAALPSVHRTGGFVAVRDAAIWIAGLFLAALFARLIAGRWPRGARYAFTAILLLIAVITSARATWAFDPLPLYGARSQLSALDRFRPSWQSTIVDLPGLARKSEADFLNRMALTMSGAEVVLDGVPAGDYDLSAVPTSATAATLAMRVGRNDAPFVAVPLDDLRRPDAPMRLHLPVKLRTLSLRTDAGAAVDGDTQFTLKPVAVAAAAAPRAATHAAQFGQARAFFFDEWAYAERDGFWLRANGTVTVVIDTQENARLAGFPISITAGAVPTTVRLSVGPLDQSFALAAGEKQEVVLPAAEGGAWRLQIRSGAGFRPSERDPASRDVRELAAWIAIK